MSGKLRYQFPSLSHACFLVCTIIFVITNGGTGAHAQTRDQAAAFAAEIGNPTNEIVFENGVALDLAKEARNRVVIVNFWAYWCANCIEEFADLYKLQTRLGDRKLSIILISDGDNWAKDLAFARKNRLPFRLAHFKPSLGLSHKAGLYAGSVSGAVLHAALPVSWVLASGQLQGGFIGNPGWSGGDADRFISTLAGKL